MTAYQPPPDLEPMRLYVPADVKRQITDLADSEERSISKQAVVLLREALAARGAGVEAPSQRRRRSTRRV